MAIRFSRGQIGAIEQLERRTLLAAIKPDISFGNDGSIRLVNPNNPNIASTNLLAVQPNNKIVTVTEFSPDKSGWAVGRFNDDGSVDTTFGDDGVFPAPTAASSFAAALQSDGKFVIGTDMTDNDNNQIGVSRVTADGKLDKTFGANGSAAATVVLQAPMNILSSVFPDDLAIGPNGKIVVAVDVEGSIPDPPYHKVAVALLRFNADGSLDKTFGDQGETSLIVADSLVNARLAIDSSNRILALDTAGGLHRFKADGSLDTSFGNAGSVEINQVDESYSASIALQDNGDILVGGQGRVTHNGKSPIVAYVVRLLPDGSVDDSFGDAGVAIVSSSLTSSAPLASQILLDNIPDKILVEDESGQIARLNGDGSLDTTFGDNGIVHVSNTQSDGATLGGPIAVDSADHVLTSDIDIVRFAPRPDVIQGKSGTLYVEGSAGDDTIHLSEKNSRITLDRDGDQSTYNPADNFPVNISADQGGNDTISISIDALATVTTGDGADSIAAADGKTTITSGDGNDTINVGDCEELIMIGDGNDDVTAGDGTMYIQGGIGDDVYTLGSGGKALYDGGGNNTVTSAGGNAKIVLADGNDVVTTMSARQPQRISTAGGDDQITTAGSNDDINAGAGKDTVSTSAGNDLINGGPGDDLLIGGSGDDILTGGTGRDTLKGSAGNDVLQGPDNFSAATSRDAFYGGDGDDTVHGTPGPDTIFGQDGNDLLFGENGADRIVGGPGIDQFYGDKGNDSIDSADGNAETVDGGTGTDVLIASDMIDHLIRVP